MRSVYGEKRAPLTVAAGAGAAAINAAAEVVRSVPGVTEVWWFDEPRTLACARHYGDLHVASAGTLLGALTKLEAEILG